jgi:STE24 endopeptidase
VPRGHPLRDFTPEQIERARRYHRPLYWSMLVDTALGAAVLAAFAFSPFSSWTARVVRGPWSVRTLQWVAIVQGAAFAVRLPLSYWGGFVREHAWGFSTQSSRGWLGDRLKALAVVLVLTGVMLVGLVGIARALPRTWPFAVAPAGAALVVVLSFVAPVMLEPLFNRFRPLDDAALAAALRELSVRAGVPVREILVADASRRSRKENAYVSGLGRTRRVVVFDTLLRRADARELQVVTAHELGHRRLRHVAAGTVLGVAGIVSGVAALWAILRAPAILHAAHVGGPGDPRAVPLLLLLLTGMELVGLPVETALSRRWERAADVFSLDLTGDLEGFAVAHRELAVSNLIDLDPPWPLYRMLFTHPTPPERIALARRWAWLRRGRGEEHAERGAAARPVLDPRAAAVQLGEARHQAEPDADPGLMGP